MNEEREHETRVWLLTYPAAGHDEEVIRRLNEAELQAALQHAGDRIGQWWVKQGDSGWYPAKTVLSKFRRLANEGIYLRRETRVEGPFTAAKTMHLLEESDLEQTQAKVGVHGDWLPSGVLLQRLRAAGKGVQHPENE